MKETKSVEKAVSVPAAAAKEASLVEGELGEIKIHENVIATLVTRAATQTEGVSRLAGSTIVDAIAGIVGSRKMQSRAIAIEMGEDNRVSVELKINILRGFKLPEVAMAVQKNVIAEVESVTGMTVVRVDVAVQDLDDEPEAEEESTEEAVPAASVQMPMP